MKTRLMLQKKLEEILGSDNVYFQPPPSIRMKYRCIVYNRSGSDTEFADNILYARRKEYQVIVIDKDPDSEIPDKIEALPFCRFDRFFTSDNLNHFVFTLFY